MSYDLESHQPTVLFIGGHDPSGGAGLQADLETAMAYGCRATSLVTCLTVQDTRDVQAVHPQSVAQFLQQAEALTDDLPPSIVKVGLLGDPDIAQATAELVRRLQVPLVLDPVLAAGGGSPLAGEALLQVIRERLLPLTTLLTPNRAESRRLAQTDNDSHAAATLLKLGASNVLVTGADESAGDQVTNRLVTNQDDVTFCWPLLPHTYHGSGCTLASACACEMALGTADITKAVKKAQQFTWQALEAAEAPGSGQWLPTRRSPT